MLPCSFFGIDSGDEDARKSAPRRGVAQLDRRRCRFSPQRSGRAEGASREAGSQVAPSAIFRADPDPGARPTGKSWTEADDHDEGGPQGVALRETSPVECVDAADAGSSERRPSRLRQLSLVSEWTSRDDLALVGDLKGMRDPGAAGLVGRPHREPRQQVRRYVAGRKPLGLDVVAAPDPPGVVTRGDAPISVSELVRHVGRVDASREQVTRERVAQILRSPVAEACAGEDPAPLPPTEVACLFSKFIRDV